MAFIAGVALAAFVAFPASLCVAASVLVIGLLAALASRRRMAFAALVGFAVAAGWVWLAANGVVAGNDLSQFVGEQPVRVRGQIVSDPARRGRFTVFTLEAASVLRSERWHTVSGKARLFVSGALDARRGDKLELGCTLQAVPEATNPGQYSPAEHLARREIRAQAYVGPKGVLRHERGSARSAHALAARARRVMFAALERTMPGDNPGLYARLLASIVYGTQIAPLPREITEAFRQSGTVHVLVVSGSQVTILVAALLLMTRARRGRLHWPHLLLAVPILVLFALLVGLGPSIRRAVSMCLLLLAGGVARRDYDAYTALALAGLIVVLMDPQAIRDVGAQLSFAAAFGVIHFLPRRRVAQMRFWPRLGLMALVGTVGAWAMTLPILAHCFHGFPLLGAFANLAVVPLAALLIPMGLVATVAALIVPPLAALLNALNRGLIDIMLGIAHCFAELPGSYVEGVGMSFGGAVVWYAGVLGLLGVVRAPWGETALRRKLAVALVVVVAAAVVWYALTLPAAELTITMLDVGDGECLVVRSPTGKTMLVDGGRATNGGEGVGREVILPYLVLRGIRRVDWLVVTHPHDDHVNGLTAVVREMPVGMVLDSGIAGDSWAAQELWRAVEAAGVPRKPARRGERVDLGGGAVAVVLSPREPVPQGTEADVNNGSVVLKLVYGRFSALLTGDLEEEGESALLRSGANVRATLLKVAHHGSETSSTPAFLRAAAPELAFISAGHSRRLDNPSPEVLERLEEVGAEVRRTDTEGAVSLKTDGRDWSVEAFRPGRRAERAAAGVGPAYLWGQVGQVGPTQARAPRGRGGRASQTRSLVAASTSPLTGG
ncbi:MAG: DNA internalization-related competence protein ComEC/Rec2 [Armatimonadota bacterium]